MAYEYQDQLQAGPTTEREPLPEDWKAKVQGLQEAVCLLLIKNQEMRMALSAERETRYPEGCCKTQNRGKRVDDFDPHGLPLQ